MMNKLAFISCFVFASLLASCYDCGGADKIESVSGISLTTFHDSVKYFAGTPLTLDFTVGSDRITRDGDRKCHRKNLVLKFENSWNANQFKLSCNRYFIHNNDTIPAGSDLLHSPICDNRINLDAGGQMNSDSRVILFNFKQPVLGLDYIFSLEGSTSDNKTFKDSCSIYIH
jgi:hypothetical protein